MSAKTTAQRDMDAQLAFGYWKEGSGTGEAAIGAIASFASPIDGCYHAMRIDFLGMAHGERFVTGRGIRMGANGNVLTPRVMTVAPWQCLRLAFIEGYDEPSAVAAGGAS